MRSAGAIKTLALGTKEPVVFSPPGYQTVFPSVDLRLAGTRVLFIAKHIRKNLMGYASNLLRTGHVSPW